MILLAVDTCSEHGSLALARDDGWCEAVALPPEWKSTTLHHELARLLERHGIKTRDLAAYAVTSGPGAFTGLRIGLTMVKALAEVHGKPIYPVSTLEVVAAAAREQLPESYSGDLISLLDARRGQIFGAIYHAEGNGLRRTSGETVCALKSFLAQVQSSTSGSVSFCATEIDRFAEEILRAGWKEAALLQVSRDLAATLARMGLERGKAGPGVSAAAAEANYVRPSDAELFWKGP